MKLNRFEIGYIIMVAAFCVFVALIGTMRQRSSVPVTAPPTAVAQRVVMLIDAHPDEWQEGIFGIENPKRGISVFTGRTPFSEDELYPEYITVRVDASEMPGFAPTDNQRHTATVSQRIVYDAYLRWERRTHAAVEAGKTAKQRQAIARLMKDPV